MKKVRIAHIQDWQQFLTLAEAEGWRVPQVECQLFQGDWLHHVRMMAEGEEFCGLVTAVAYQHSGWIGNLVVPRELRGRGYGSKLFAAALTALEEQELTSVWLTASAKGQPLYEKAGFVKVGEIERWVSQVRTGCTSEAAPAAVAAARLREADRLAWGEDRTSLLDALVAQGKVFACEDAVALLQQEPGMQIIGPWYAPLQSLRANRSLLHMILSAAEPNVEIVVDVLASSPVRRLLAATGFTSAGKNTLMVKGDIAKVDLTKMVSLASLGSIG